MSKIVEAMDKVAEVLGLRKDVQSKRDAYMKRLLDMKEADGANGRKYKSIKTKEIEKAWKIK